MNEDLWSWCNRAFDRIARDDSNSEAWWITAGMLAEELEGKDDLEAMEMLASVERMMQERRSR